MILEVAAKLEKVECGGARTDVDQQFDVTARTILTPCHAAKRPHVRRVSMCCCAEDGLPVFDQPEAQRRCRDEPTVHATKRSARPSDGPTVEIPSTAVPGHWSRGTPPEFLEPAVGVEPTT